MKKNHRTKIWLAAILCFALTNSVWADNPNRPESTAPHLGLLAQAYPLPGQSERPAGKAETNMKLTMPGQVTKFNKASKLIGMEVQNPEGQKLGDIKDIVINLTDSTVSYAVLGSGGVLGIGEKLLAVPLTAFTRSADQKHLVLRSDRNNISRAEGIGNNWPSVENPSFGAMPFWQKPNSKSMSTNTNSVSPQQK